MIDNSFKKRNRLKSLDFGPISYFLWGDLAGDLALFFVFLFDVFLAGFF